MHGGSSRQHVKHVRGAPHCTAAAFHAPSVQLSTFQTIYQNDPRALTRKSCLAPRRHGEASVERGLRSRLPSRKVRSRQPAAALKRGPLPTVPRNVLACRHSAEKATTSSNSKDTAASLGFSTVENRMGAVEMTANDSDNPMDGLYSDGGGYLEGGGDSNLHDFNP